MTKILSLCMIAHVESKRVAVGYGDERRSVPLLGGPRGAEEASSAGCARGKDTSGDSPALWCGPGHSDPVDGALPQAGEVGLDARSKGRSLHPALGEEEAAMVLELVSRHSPDQLGLPFFSLDSRGSRGTDQEAVGLGALPVDGGETPQAVEPYSSEAGPPCL
jgi:hypothetical protein